jgi:hypothetical protein
MKSLHDFMQRPVFRDFQNNSVGISSALPHYYLWMGIKYVIINRKSSWAKGFSKENLRTLGLSLEPKKLNEPNKP